MLILQVGDRPLRRDQDAIDLKQQGVHRERVHTIQETVLFVRTYDFDVVLADLDLLGLDPIREIRAISRIPIIGITTSPDPRTKVGALDFGADDVITQFCGLEELLARIRAVVRRRYGFIQSAIRCGRIEIDLVAREARVGELPLRLSPKEYLLLEFLILKRGAAVSKAACITRLYGTDDHPEAKTIDVVLCRLRKRLAPHDLSAMIESVWGFGYKLGGSPEIPTDLRDRQGRLVPA